MPHVLKPATPEIVAPLGTHALAMQEDMPTDGTMANEAQP
jgi:hypothetical protein